MSLTDEQMFALLAYANDADSLDVSDEEIRRGHRRVKVYAEVARRAYALGHTAGIHTVTQAAMEVDYRDDSCPDCVCCSRLHCHRGEGSECRGESCPCTEG
jgi:hypothetical protein